MTKFLTTSRQVMISVAIHDLLDFGQGRIRLSPTRKTKFTTNSDKIFDNRL